MKTPQIGTSEGMGTTDGVHGTTERDHRTTDSVLEDHGTTDGDLVDLDDLGKGPLDHGGDHG